MKMPAMSSCRQDSTHTTYYFHAGLNIRMGYSKERGRGDLLFST